MIFDGWQDVLRVLVVGVAAYVALVVLLRVSGKRTLTKLNAFDLVVTVALGSTLATVLLSGTVALVEGVVGLALLVLLQLVITWTAVRWPRFRRFVKSEPTLLLQDGEFLDGAMERERVTRAEVLAALRGSGLADRGEAAAVVLETDGSLSVVKASDGGSRVSSTLANLPEAR